MVEKKSPAKIALIVVGIVVAVIVALVVIGSFMGGSDDMQGSSLNQEQIDHVCKFSPDGANGITYKQAYDHFYADSTWKYFESEDNEPVVEFSGRCTYDEKEGDAYLQFTLNASGDIVGYYAQFKYDGEDDKVELSDDERGDLVFKPFVSYADEVKKEPLTEEQIAVLYLEDTDADVPDEDTQIGTSSDDSDDSDSGSSLDDYDFDPCYAGVTNSDDEYAYLGVVDGEQAILVFYESDTNENICMAGDVTIDEDTGYCTLTDDETGVSLTFTVEEQDDGSYLLDLGDDGQIYLEQISSDDFVDCLKNLALYTDNVF